MELDFEVHMDGPLFNGQAVQIMERYKYHLGDVLSEYAVNYIRAYLPTQYMYLGHNGGTPAYNPVPANAGELQASITAERASPETVMVHGDRVVQGAWIEGVSDMNAVVWRGRIRRGLPGRFPGYHTFRLATQDINMVAPSIADDELQRYLVELNSYA